MHHAKRKRLTTDDFDKALKWARIEPLHGNQTGCPTHFSPTQNPSVFIVEDHELNLTSATFESPLSEDFQSETPRVEGIASSHVTVKCVVCTLKACVSIQHHGCLLKEHLLAQQVGLEVSILCGVAMHGKVAAPLTQ